MIRINEIQEKLLHLIGWQQNYDTTSLKIAGYLTQSESGLFFQQAHPLITLDNLSSLAPDFKSVEYPWYSPKNQYEKGNIVEYDGKCYKAQQQVPADSGITDTSYWVETNPFSEWLEDKTKASIQKTIMRFINEKLVKGANKNILENKTLFDGTGRIVDTIKNKKNLVGFEIVPIRAKGITTKINRIGLQFTKAGEYTLYLMHSSCDKPIQVIKLTKTKDNSIEWFNTPQLYLPYESENTDAGGSWYLCYCQSELPEGSQAIRKNFDWSKGPCTSCSRREYISWQAWSKYLEVSPFYVNEELISDYNEESLRMWDVENNIYTFDTNYGLNLDITISCDVSDFIIKQRELFIDVIMKQLGVDILREFAYNANVRTNRHSINASKVDLLYELDGDSTSLKKSGLNYQLNEAFKALTISTQGLDRVCLPCVNNGIRYRVV